MQLAQAGGSSGGVSEQGFFHRLPQVSAGFRRFPQVSAGSGGALTSSCDSAAGTRARDSSTSTASIVVSGSLAVFCRLASVSEPSLLPFSARCARAPVQIQANRTPPRRRARSPMVPASVLSSCSPTDIPDQACNTLSVAMRRGTCHVNPCAASARRELPM